jgi:hypothetical protein
LRLAHLAPLSLKPCRRRVISAGRYFVGRWHFLLLSRYEGGFNFMLPKRRFSEASPPTKTKILEGSPPVFWGVSFLKRNLRLGSVKTRLRFFRVLWFSHAPPARQTRAQYF